MARRTRHGSLHASLRSTFDGSNSHILSSFLDFQDNRFALALMEAFQGKADVFPAGENGRPAGDGVITATEMYLYLRDRVADLTQHYSRPQTPGLWPLRNHRKGEFVFTVPGHILNLPQAPELSAALNPYRGLESFEAQHQHLFFGRGELIQELAATVSQQALTVVLGASGTGKSSLVKAGLVPYLQQSFDGNWQVLPIVRPGIAPCQALLQALQLPSLLATPVNELTTKSFISAIQQWRPTHPAKRLLLVIDQAEELYSLCRFPEERDRFLQFLSTAILNCGETLHVVLTLRSDFEPQFRETMLSEQWTDSRFLIRSMSRSELRAAIEEPAALRVMYFEPPSLVETLIDEVTEMPGALPLLSFTLSELYLKYLHSAHERIDRAITEADYTELGGIKQSLIQRAEEEYTALVQKEVAYEKTIRHVMLRMVAISGNGNTRRQVSLTELEYPYPESDRVPVVIKCFKEARLLVSDTTAEGQPYLEPAHDALMEGWPRLLQWLESSTKQKQADQVTSKGWKGWVRSLWSFGNDSQGDTFDEREKLLLQRRLTPAANDWHREQKPKYLWHADARLPQLKQIRDREPGWFNTDESEFVQRSLARKRFNVALRWVTLLGITAAAVLVAFVGNELRRRAVVAQEEAEENRIEAERRNVVNLAENSRSAFESEHFSEALISAIQAGGIVQSEPDLREDESLKILATTTLFRAFYGLGDEKNSWEYYGLSGKSSAINTEANLIASAENTLVKVWQINSGDLTLEKNLEYTPERIILLPNRNYFATLGNPRLVDGDKWELSIDLWQLGEGESVPLEDFVPEDWTNVIHSLSPSVIESLLVAFDQDKNLDGLLSQIGPEELMALQKIAYHPLEYQVLGFTKNELFLLDLEFGQKTILSTVNELDTQTTSSDQCRLDSECLEETDEYGFPVLAREVIADDIAFSQDGKTIISVGGLTEVSKWNLNGERLDTLKFDARLCNTLRQAGVSPNPYVARDTVRLSPDGSLVAVACNNGAVKFWNTHSSPDNEAIPVMSVEINYFRNDDATGTFGGSFSKMIFDSDSPIIGIENILNGRESVKFIYLEEDTVAKPNSFDQAIYDFAYSADESTLALLKEDGMISIMDITGEEIITFPVIEENYSFFLGNFGHIENGGLRGFKGRARVTFSHSGKEIAVSYGDCKYEENVQIQLPNIILYDGSILEEHNDCWQSIVKIFDLLGRVISTLVYPENIENIVFSAEDELLIVFGNLSEIGIFDRQKNTFGSSDLYLPDIEYSNLYASALSPSGKLIAIATGEDEFRDNESAASLQVLSLETQEAFTLPVGNAANQIVDLSFSKDSEILTLGMSNSARVQAWNLEALEPIVNQTEINRVGGSRLVSASLHPSESLFAVTTGQAQVGKTLTIGTQIVDSSGEVVVDFKDVSLEKIMFSHGGSRLNAIRLENSGRGTRFDGFLTWDFDLDRLLEKSCDYLQNYLNSPVLSEQEQASCDANFRSAASHATNNSENESRQSSWKWPFLRREADVASESSKPPTVKTNSETSGESDNSSSFGESASALALQPFANEIDLIGLDGPLSEQETWSKLHLQSAVWDIDAVFTNLNTLQQSPNICIANFAVQFHATLTELSYDGFFQINDIKRELNEQEDCGLPIIPFEFAP